MNNSSPRTVKTKYRNKRSNGFDSKREEKRGMELEWLQKAGDIESLQRQVRYELIPKQEGERAVYYVADFVYVGEDENGTTRVFVEDVKSPMTRKLPAYVIKRKLMLWRHGIKIREV